MANNTLTVPQLGTRYVDYRKDCWGDSFNWSFNRKLDQVVKLAIHHSVTAPGPDWKAEVDRIGELHKARGWAGIGYHFIITTQGFVAYVGDIGLGRANILNHNEKIIGICLIGDFTKHLPTDIQINSAHDLCNFFINSYPPLKNITSWDQLMGHKDAVSLWGNTTVTACPGSSWPVDFKSRIKDNIVYSPAPVSNTIPQETPEAVTPPPEPTTDTPADIPPDDTTESVPTNGSDTPNIIVESGPGDVSMASTTDPTTGGSYTGVSSPTDTTEVVVEDKQNALVQLISLILKKLFFWFR